MSSSSFSASIMCVSILRKKLSKFWLLRRFSVVFLASIDRVKVLPSLAIYDLSSSARSALLSDVSLFTVSCNVKKL